MNSFLREFILQLRLENKSENTIYNYQLSLKDYIFYLKNEWKIKSTIEINKSHKCEPRKPAAPVIKTFLFIFEIVSKNKFFCY